MSYSTELRRELVGQINRKEHIAGNLIADKTKDGDLVLDLSLINGLFYILFFIKEVGLVLRKNCGTVNILKVFFIEIFARQGNCLMNNQNDIHQLLDFIPHITMISHRPGRIDLQVALSGLSKIKGMNMNPFGLSIPGILNIKPKLLSRSVIVFYDPGIFPSDLFERLVQLKEKPDPNSPIFEELKRVLKGSHET